MFPHLEERASDSRFVEKVWSTHSEQEGSFTSISTVLWSLVVAKCQGRISISFHGPQTGAAATGFPPEAEWFGISFKLGTYVPVLPPDAFVDGLVVLPASGRSFSLRHSHWEFPTFENADTFVDQLVRAGLLEQEPVLNAEDQGPTLSLRALQYRFRRSTGLSLRTIRQIERARRATALLKRGVSILDTVFEAGYSDQPHLTRSLKHFIGRTPAEIPSSPLIAL